MANRASKEEKVLEYFRTEPLASVRIVFGLVKAEVKKRETADSASPAPKKKPGKKAGAKKTSNKQNAAPSAAEMAGAKTAEAPLKS